MNSVFEFFKYEFFLTLFLHNGRRYVLPLITQLLLLGCFQSVFATPTTPTSDFIINNIQNQDLTYTPDGTVTDRKTGLMWQRCAAGQTWTKTTCTGKAKVYNYYSAQSSLNTFAGYNDWRLPSIEELHSIVEREKIEPAINKTIFPNTPQDWFWSSSLYAANTYNAWIVNFRFGNDYNESKNYDYAVRLVRNLSFGDFTDNQDGTVTHKRTGLMWQRCPLGKTWTGTSCSGVSKSLTFNEANIVTSDFAGYTDWRLPNTNELLSIVNYETYSPAIDKTQFPNTSSEGFWSSSPYVYSSYLAWLVDFDKGSDLSASKNDSYAVRLVRQPTQVVLFLHGMNSGSETWNPIVSNYFNESCPTIYNGAIKGIYSIPNTQNTHCFRIEFGAFDATSTNKGLDGAWTYGETNNYDSAGDYSTFSQLGIEVDKAINRIKKILPNSQILLVGHSRGGLAARAFLQNPNFSQNKANVVGLITIGTPHKGTRTGRVYRYIKENMLDTVGARITNTPSTKNDWHVVGFLNGSESHTVFFIDVTRFNIDARRPVIGDLADTSLEIKALNSNKNIAYLPSIKYGAIAYTLIELGVLSPAYGLFDNVGNNLPELSTEAEIYIKGAKANGDPKPSINYIGDGIVPVQSQWALPHTTTTLKTYDLIHHIGEPTQTAHIAAMACELGFPWLTNCADTAQALISNQAKAHFTASHDYDRLVSLKTAQLWQNWLAVFTDDNKANQREQFAVALGIKLRGGDDAAFYADIRQRLVNTNALPLERARLAKLLAEIATSSALEILTDALLNPEYSAIHNALSNAILTVADSLPEQPRRADLSLILESAWTLPKQNQEQQYTLALALAKLGTPRGVELLLTAVDKTGAFTPSVKKKTLSYEEQQAMAAFMAMDEIINPDSETMLSRAFMNHRATEAVFIAAGNGLVNLGRDDAAQLVLQRLHELPDNAVPVGQHWLTSLSGKIDKTALRNMNKSVGMPRQGLLRQQMEDMVK